MSWPMDDIAELERMWSEGHSATAIGVALGRSRNAILGKVHRLKLSARRVRTRKPIERRADRLSPKLSPRPKVAAKRERAVPPPPPLNEAPKPPRYIPKEQLRKPLPGSNPHAVLIETTGCKFPVGEYPFHWCNEPKVAGKSYCAAHCAVAFQQDLKALKPREVAHV